MPTPGRLWPPGWSTPDLEEGAAGAATAAPTPMRSNSRAESSVAALGRVSPRGKTTGRISSEFKRLEKGGP
jgi:hypothetical protein